MDSLNAWRQIRKYEDVAGFHGNKWKTSRYVNIEPPGAYLSKMISKVGTYSGGGGLTEEMTHLNLHVRRLTTW